MKHNTNTSHHFVQPVVFASTVLRMCLCA